jgi:glycerol-3-phosphate acyltransferase PlsY
MKFVFSFIIGYFSGSLMFCYWLGKLAGKDITRIGDGNPGAFNLFKAGGPLLGTAGLMLVF